AKTVAVSSDSKRVAYWANCTQEVLGVEGEGFGEVMRKSPFGVQQVLGVWRIVVDGKEVEEYGRILGTAPIFSPDSKRVAYVAVMQGEMFVVVDGKKDRSYDAIAQNHPIFSADSKRVAYMAKRRDKYVVVLDGQEGNEYDGIGKGCPIFSPDSKRVAYEA